MFYYWEKKSPCLWVIVAFPVISASKTVSLIVLCAHVWTSWRRSMSSSAAVDGETLSEAVYPRKRERKERPLWLEMSTLHVRHHSRYFLHTPFFWLRFGLVSVHLADGALFRHIHGNWIYFTSRQHLCWIWNIARDSSVESDWLGPLHTNVDTVSGGDFPLVPEHACFSHSFMSSLRQTRCQTSLRRRREEPGSSVSCIIRYSV